MILHCCSSKGKYIISNEQRDVRWVGGIHKTVPELLTTARASDDGTNLVLLQTENSNNEDIDIEMNLVERGEFQDVRPCMIVFPAALQRSFHQPYNHVIL